MLSKQKVHGVRVARGEGYLGLLESHADRVFGCSNVVRSYQMSQSQLLNLVDDVLLCSSVAHVFSIVAFDEYRNVREIAVWVLSLT